MGLLTSPCRDPGCTRLNSVLERELGNFWRQIGVAACGEKLETYLIPSLAELRFQSYDITLLSGDELTTNDHLLASDFSIE